MLRKRSGEWYKCLLLLADVFEAQRDEANFNAYRELAGEHESTPLACFVVGVMGVFVLYVLAIIIWMVMM